MKLAIATPLHSSHEVHALFAWSLAETFRGYPDCIWLTIASSEISANRGALLQQFLLRSDADILLWIDSDQAWTPKDVEIVTAPVAANPKCVCAAAVSLKVASNTYAVAFHEEDVDRMKGYVGPIYDSLGWRYGRAKRLGTGFLACSRPALEAAVKMTPKYRALPSYRIDPKNQNEEHSGLFAVRIDSGNLLTDDFGASEYFALAGVELLFSFDAEVKHMEGRMAYGGDLPLLHGFASRVAKP